MTFETDTMTLSEALGKVNGLSDVRELDRAWRSWHKLLARSERTDGGVIVRAQSASGSTRSTVRAPGGTRSPWSTMPPY